MNEALEDLPPLNASGMILREVAVLGANMGSMKENFEEFRRETRDNFDRAKDDQAALRKELKEDTHAIEAKMEAGFMSDRQRLTSLEDTRTGGKGMYLGLRFVLAILSVGPVSAFITYLATK